MSCWAVTSGVYVRIHATSNIISGVYLCTHATSRLRQRRQATCRLRQGRQVTCRLRQGRQGPVGFAKDDGILFLQKKKNLVLFPELIILCVLFKKN